jgi:hypothetical protein
VHADHTGPGPYGTANCVGTHVPAWTSVMSSGRCHQKLRVSTINIVLAHAHDSYVFCAVWMRDCAYVLRTVPLLAIFFQMTTIAWEIMKIVPSDGFLSRVSYIAAFHQLLMLYVYLTARNIWELMFILLVVFWRTTVGVGNTCAATLRRS